MSRAFPFATKTTFSGSFKALYNVKDKLKVQLLFQSLMCAHDAVAQKDFYPHLPEIPIEMDEDEETIKIVQLVKSNEPLVRILYHF